MSRVVNMVPLVDISKVVGSTVYAKEIHVMAEDECYIIDGSQKKVNIWLNELLLMLTNILLSKGGSTSMLLLTK